MRLSRRPTTHKTAGVDPTVWWEFQPGERVMTREGIAGVVDEVSDGPLPGNEEYLVTLDAGLGGGRYAPGELRSLSTITAATDRILMYRNSEHAYTLCPSCYRKASGRGEDLAGTTPIRSGDPSLHEGIEVCSDCGKTLANRIPKGARIAGSAACPCCTGYGEHDTGRECYACDGSGERTAGSRVPCDASIPEYQDSLDIDGTLDHVTAGVAQDADPSDEDDEDVEDDPDDDPREMGLEGEASVHTHYASDDYPELGDILVERPPLENTHRTASRQKVADAWDLDFDSGLGHADEEYIQSEAGIMDFLFHPIRSLEHPVQTLAPGFSPGHNWSYDWCRFRRNSHCFYPRILDEVATRAAGYSVWVPEDRGQCPRISWNDQKMCPIGAPGPHSGDSHALTDATVPWNQGGQRGGHPGAGPSALPQYRHGVVHAAVSVSFEEPGQVGNRTHITREESGTLPTSMLASIPGKMGEQPGEHRNRHGAEWEDFKHDIKTNGIQHPIFITVDHNEQPQISEGNHRRDAAMELGLPEVPVQVRYFGHAERQGSVHERLAKTAMERNGPGSGSYAVGMPPEEDIDKQGMTCPYCWGEGTGGAMPIPRLGNRCGKCLGLGFLDARMKLGSRVDEEFRFHFTAAWSDVRSKAKKIRSEGHVRIIAAPSPRSPYIVAEVQGDTGTYETRLLRTLGGKSVAAWECGCKWAEYSWGRTGRWKRFEGRMCSHALATVFQAQADEMFGGKVKEIGKQPLWREHSDQSVQQPWDSSRGKASALQGDGSDEGQRRPTGFENESDWGLHDARAYSHRMRAYTHAEYGLKVGKEHPPHEMGGSWASHGGIIDNDHKYDIHLIEEEMRRRGIKPRPLPSLAPKVDSLRAEWKADRHADSRNYDAHSNADDRTYWPAESGPSSLPEEPDQDHDEGDFYDRRSPHVAAYTFDVDFSHSKDHLKEGEVVSGTHRVTTDGANETEARLVAEQMVAATGREPTKVRRISKRSSLDRMHPVSTAKHLFGPPIRSLAHDLVREGANPNLVLAYMIEMGTPNAISVLSQAMQIEPFKGNVHGIAYTFTHIDGDLAVTDGGQVFPLGQIEHPEYDPVSGLNFVARASDTISPGWKPEGVSNPHATDFESLPKQHQDRIAQHVLDNSPDKSNPLTHEQMVQNIVDHAHRAASEVPGAIKTGEAWYPQAHKLSGTWGKKYGMAHHNAAGMMAALSPNSTWESNVTTAHYMARHLGKNTDERFRFDADDVHRQIDARKQMTSGDRKAAHASAERMRGLAGKRFHDMSHEEAASALFHQSKYTDHLRDEIGDPVKSNTADTRKGQMRLTNWSYQPNVIKAVRIARGEHPDKVLSGHKVRSFYNNIIDPHNKSGGGHVTIDSHAISAAANAKYPASGGPIKKLFDQGNADLERNHNAHGSYSYFAHAYREAHRRLQADGTMSPHSTPADTQAVVWNEWKRQMDRKKGDTGHAFPVVTGAVGHDAVPDDDDQGVDETQAQHAINPWTDPDDTEPDPDIYPDENREWHERHPDPTDGMIPINPRGRQAEGAKVLDGVMVALVPPEDISQQLLARFEGQDGTESLDNQHITVLYLGHPEDVDEDVLHTVVEGFAMSHPVLEGHVGGVGTFLNDDTVVVALWDIPGLEEYKVELEKDLESAGIRQGSTHGYTAHQTLQYLGEAETASLPGEVPSQVVQFPEIVVAYGGDWTRYPLTGHYKAVSRTEALLDPFAFMAYAEGDEDAPGRTADTPAGDAVDPWMDTDEDPWFGDQTNDNSTPLSGDYYGTSPTDEMTVEGRYITRDEALAAYAEDKKKHHKGEPCPYCHHEGCPLCGYTGWWGGEGPEDADEDDEGGDDDSGSGGDTDASGGTVEAIFGRGDPYWYHQNEKGDIVGPYGSHAEANQYGTHLPSEHAWVTISSPHPIEEAHQITATNDEVRDWDWPFEERDAFNDGSTAELHDEPEPALPETDGADDVPAAESRSWIRNGTTVPSIPGNADIALAAREALAKMGTKTFSASERDALINEGEEVTARNLDRLDIGGTHYMQLEEALAAEEESDVLWD